MVIVEDLSNNDDAFTLKTLSSEYNRLLQNTQIFSNLYKIGGKYNTTNNDPYSTLMIVPCNQLVCMVVGDDASKNFDDFTLRTVSMEYNGIVNRIYQQYTQIFTN
jgi:hypothetical protein